MLLWSHADIVHIFASFILLLLPPPEP
jgi:hypothetical protein